MVIATTGVLFGLASILALYLFGRQVTSASESLLAAALLTFSYHHVWFSQNARGYTGLLFWTLLSSWLLLRALRNGAARRNGFCMRFRLHWGCIPISQ